VSSEKIRMYLIKISGSTISASSFNNARLSAEINVIKLCKPEMEKDYTSLIDRVDSLEKKLEKGVVVAQSQSPRTHTHSDLQIPEADSYLVQVLELPYSDRFW